MVPFVSGARPPFTAMGAPVDCWDIVDQKKASTMMPSPRVRVPYCLSFSSRVMGSIVHSEDVHTAYMHMYKER